MRGKRLLAGPFTFFFTLRIHIVAPTVQGTNSASP